jgi:glycosyltransferase involved in cell wall biosynthesis
MKIGYLMQAGVPDVRRHGFSGPANHVRYVVAELRKLGHHIRLLALIDDQIWKSEDLDSFEPVVVRGTDQGIFRWLERGLRRTQYELSLPYAALFESLRFASACRQELAGYDLLYERMGWFGYGGGLAARWLRVPLILEINGDHLTELEMRGIPPTGVQRWLSVALTKKAVGLASRVVAAGEGLRKNFIDRWGVTPEKVTVVENGSELVRLLDRSGLRSFRPHPGRDGATTIVFLGGFDPWHGTSILIRAMAMGVARGVSLELLLVGSGPGREAAEQLVREQHLDDVVTFAGELAPGQFATVLAQADIGVSPYCGRTEFLGMKLIDYKAAGLAIIASGEHSQPGIIEHGRTGWIVPPCDEQALCDAILRLAFDVGLRRQMGRAARIEAEQLHDWSRTGQRLNELFSRAVEEHHELSIRTKGRNVFEAAERRVPEGH